MSEKKEKKVLEIGCGLRPFFEKGCKIIHSDKLKLPHVEIVHDLNKFPYPFKNNEFDEIIASHVLEHLDDIPKVMEELYRILKPNGILKVRVPHFSFVGAFNDPMHKHFFTLNSFDYWDKKTPIGKILNFEVRNIEFKIIKKEIIFCYFRNFKIKFLARNSKIWSIYENWISKFFPATEIYFELKKIG